MSEKTILDTLDIAEKAILKIILLGSSDLMGLPGSQVSGEGEPNDPDVEKMAKCVIVATESREAAQEFFSGKEINDKRWGKFLESRKLAFEVLG